MSVVEGMHLLLRKEGQQIFDFRYDDDTQRAMAREVLREAGGGRAAIISAPSVMNGIKVSLENSRPPRLPRRCFLPPKKRYFEV